MSETKVLNLYAGIGGNRKRWVNVDVTAVEWDGEKADIYRDHFPDDTVVEADAHDYLLEHYGEFDFIWTSPPCPTHSRIRKATSGPNQQNEPKYPDMTLYEEILFLKGYCTVDSVVENVKSWYRPLVKPQEVMRHYLWSNFHIPDVEYNEPNLHRSSVSDIAKRYDYDLSQYDLPNYKKRQMLRNCVHPRLGEHVFNAATSVRQTTLL